MRMYIPFKWSVGGQRNVLKHINLIEFRNLILVQNVIFSFLFVHAISCERQMFKSWKKKKVEKSTARDAYVCCIEWYIDLLVRRKLKIANSICAYMIIEYGCVIYWRANNANSTIAFKEDLRTREVNCEKRKMFRNSLAIHFKICEYSYLPRQLPHRTEFSSRPQRIKQHDTRTKIFKYIHGVRFGKSITICTAMRYWRESRLCWFANAAIKFAEIRLKIIK